MKILQQIKYELQIVYVIIISYTAEKLILNVKCDGYAMDVSIICENNKGQTYTLSNSKINDLDFGQVIKSIFIQFLISTNIHL